MNTQNTIDPMESYQALLRKTMLAILDHYGSPREQYEQIIEFALKGTDLSTAVEDLTHIDSNGIAVANDPEKFFWDVKKIFGPKIDEFRRPFLPPRPQPPCWLVQELTAFWEEFVVWKPAPGPVDPGTKKIAKVGAIATGAVVAAGWISTGKKQ